MTRVKAGRIIIWLGLVFLACAAHHTSAQEEENVVPKMEGEDVIIREVKPQLETMGLIWIQEGDVRRLAYVVQSGDTLWDIAGRYLNSPYYWPKIWERNTFIINPHLIFPGDILYVYPEGLTERPYLAEGGTEIPTVTPLGEEKKGQKLIYQSVSSTGFISLEELEAAGKIVDNVEHKAMLGDNDMVYVDVGKVDRVVVGDRYSIFRVAENDRGGYLRIVHPVTGRLVGYQILNLGELKIEKVEANVSTAVIENAYREIGNGDLIKPFLQPLEVKVDLTATETESLHGYIVASKDDKRLIGDNDVVYIDRGAEDGVVRGNKFVIYKPCEIIRDGLQESAIRIPEKIIGQLVVLETRENTSVALVSEATEEIAVGERIFMSKFDSWEIEGVSQPVEIEDCRNDPKCRLINEQEYKKGMDNPFCESGTVRADSKSRWNIKEEE